MQGRAGELAALVTALCWCVSALSFEEAGRRIGSIPVNIIRLMFATVFLCLLAWLMRGAPFPTGASAHTFTWLVISGLVGFTFGDLCLFRAFVLIGVRLSMLIMTMAPPMAAVMGWIALGETLAVRDVVGIALTVTGVAAAVTERAPSQPRQHLRGSLGRGIVLALGGALGQAGGLVLSKYAMGTYPPLSATQIRVFAGLLGFAVVISAIRAWPRVVAARRSAPGMGLTALGALFGPVIGVSLALYAVQHTATGIASSIMATPPILIIPFAAVVHKERITARAVAAAAIALAGVLILFS